jgi:Bacterial Ig-like domain (group 3)
MMIRRNRIAIVAFVSLAWLPLMANRRPDTGNSSNGSFSNCPAKPGGGVCAALSTQGTFTLKGTDQSDNPVTVTITVYNWGFYPCTLTACKSEPEFNSSVIDVVLTGSDSVAIASFVMKTVLADPSYVSCSGETSSEGIACINAPEPDSENVEEPTPITGADLGASINTRWDFGGVPSSNPPLPAISFDQLQCLGPDDGNDQICDSTPLGEAILTVHKPKLATTDANYSVTLTDGTKLGSFPLPASPTLLASNNTQAAATVIRSLPFKQYVDSSQANPGINADGSMSYPSGFALAPTPPGSSSTLPSCYPTNEVTGTTDTRSFRTLWYTYTPSSNQFISINTAGSRYDTLVYVFTGAASAPTTVACDDDAPSGLLQAGTTFPATQGTEYWMVVYQTPTIQTTNPGTLTGYPLSVDGALHLSVASSTSAPSTTTKLTASPGTSKSGQQVELIATVTSKSPGVPTGKVTFSYGATILGTSALNGTQATLFTTALPVGTDTITASYSGDSLYLGSSGTHNYVVK